MFCGSHRNHIRAICQVVDLNIRRARIVSTSTAEIDSIFRSAILVILIVTRTQSIGWVLLLSHPSRSKCFRVRALSKCRSRGRRPHVCLCGSRRIRAQPTAEPSVCPAARSPRPELGLLVHCVAEATDGGEAPPNDQSFVRDLDRAESRGQAGRREAHRPAAEVFRAGRQRGGRQRFGLREGAERTGEEEARKKKGGGGSMSQPGSAQALSTSSRISRRRACRTASMFSMRRSSKVS